MSWQHQKLAAGEWYKLNLAEQLANVGSEVSRTLGWKEKGREDYSERAFWRALELLDLTRLDPKNSKRLGELCRLREVLVDYFVGDNEYNSTSELWNKYFLAFNYVARKKI